jgi:DNA-binding response OmpR family regulator
MDMAANNTILCIHPDPDQLSLLQENGYELLTATNGHDGLRLFASQPVNAIVLDYHLGFLDGTLVAKEIKRARPTIPIVMVADNLELPYDALNSVDALVTKSDGAHFLWATVHFVLNVRPAQSREGKLETQMRAHLR